MTDSLAQQHDLLVLDLDGTVYLGGEPIEYVADAVAEATRQGSRAIYVTNNASRPPDEVAVALQAMGIPAGPDDVLTSPQVASSMLAATHPAGSAVLVVGAPWLAQSVRDVGLEPVRVSGGEHPPVAVVQGHSPETGWHDLAEACIVLRTGADWVACNVDSTLPTDRGLLPGNGAMVAALRAATGLTPRVAGKPGRPLLDDALARTGSTRALIVGDRLDTDIEFAHTAATPSLLVFTGVSTPADLLAAPEEQRPTWVCYDLRGMVDPERAARVDPGPGPAFEDESWTVTVDDGRLRLAAKIVPNEDGVDVTDASAPDVTDPSAPDVTDAPAWDDADGTDVTDGSDVTDLTDGSAASDGAALRALALLAAAAWVSGTVEVGAADPAAASALKRSGLDPA